MTDIERKCPEGRDFADFLSYVEGDLDEVTRLEIERHIEGCAACASTVEDLRRGHRLLKGYPEVFHPDETELYKYVTEEISPDSPISVHVHSCAECQRDADVLRDMIAASREIPDQPSPMPKRLLRRLEREYGKEPPSSWAHSLPALVSDLARLLFRAPPLALGTVTALVVLALLAVPLWRTFEKVPHGGTTLMQDLERTSETGKGSASEELEKRDLATPPNIQPPMDVRKRASDSVSTLSESKQEPAYAPSLSSKPASPAAPIPVSPDKMKEASSRYPGAARSLTRPQKRMSLQSRHGVSHPESADKKRPADFMQGRGRAVREKEKAPQESQHLRIPVEIRVVDAGGKPIPWLRGQLSPSLEEKYRLVEPGRKEAGTHEMTRLARSPRPSEESVRPSATRTVVVRVATTGHLYDLHATLSGPTGEILKTADALRVPRQSLESEVRSLVLSLLSTR